MSNNPIEKSENVASNPSEAEVRASVTWCDRISQFQLVHAGFTNTRPVLTKIVQNFLCKYSKTWNDIISNNGGIDGYFGSKTKQCVEEFQSLKGLYVDGVVGENTWYQIGYSLLDEDPSNGYIYFLRDGAYILRALNSDPYTFYYPVTDIDGNLKWYTIPEY